jgi:DegV family protein with EDD domain
MLIVTDTAVDLPAGLALSPLVRIVSGDVRQGDRPLVCSNEELWDQIRRGEPLSTAPPTVDALADAYRQSEMVCAIHVSGELSATLARAREAADRMGPRLTIVDSRSFSVGAGLVVAAVHRSIDVSIPEASAFDLASSLPGRLHTFALVEDVKSLKRSGRTGLLPEVHLHNRPVVLGIRGRALFLEQAKDRSAGLASLVTHARSSAQSGLGAWALGHGDATDRDAVVEQLAKGLGRAPSFVTSLGPVVGTHIGPNAIVVGVISGHVDL